MDTQNALPIGEEQLKYFMEVLMRYRTGRVQTEQRIISSENWWKGRNLSIDAPTGVHQCHSGWLHNVITSKHADAIRAYPEANILPREPGDRQESKKLSKIIPCVLEHNDFEQTYSDIQWQKGKTGTGAYKITWDQSKLNGLGDISIERASLLNIYTEPGITDIQKSRFLFHTELYDKQVLWEMYPQLQDKLKSSTFTSAKFLYDDPVDDTNKATVIDVYYHKGHILHYCKFVEDIVLYSTENDTEPVKDAVGNVKPSPAEVGLYDHGMYPYVFDILFPIEGSPYGYGYVDICRNPQTEIDEMKTAFLQNVKAGAIPRYFSRADGNINEEQFLNLSNPLVKVTGNVDEATLRRIEHNTLDGNYISMLDRTIEELRHTSGNTEASTGAVPSGVTSASGIAALQEASGKGSVDATMNSYRAFSRVIEQVIELMRQFYDLPRQFRILGEYGAEEFVTYTNAGLKDQPYGMAFGQDMGMRRPVFDVKVSAQKKSAYNKVAQNEMAIQFFQLGFFNPQMSDQALMCLSIMDFDEKDEIMQAVAKNGTMFQKLIGYMQIAYMLTPDANQKNQIMADMAQITGGKVPQGMQEAEMPQVDNISGGEKKEHAVVEKAREQAQSASQAV